MHKKWREKTNAEVKKKWDIANKNQKWIYTSYTHKLSTVCIAVGFILLSLTAKCSVKEAIAEIREKYPNINFGRGVSREVLTNWRARCGDIGSEWFREDMERNIQIFLHPGSRNVIDESLPLAKHKEPLQGKRELVKIPRKPSNIGFLIYMLCCCYLYSRLPIMFALVINRYNNRLTPSQAFMQLLQKRYIHGRGCPISLVADSAFSKRSLRAVVGTHGVFTDGIVADLTMSMNSGWDSQLWKAMAGNLNPWQYRVFYSQENESTVCVIRVRTRGKIYTLFRWTNAYTYPCAPLPPPNPEQPPSVSDSGFTLHTAQILLSIEVEQLRLLAYNSGTSTDATSKYALVQAITGLDVFAHESYTIRASSFPEGDNVVMPNGKVVLVSDLKKKNLKFLKELCARENLLSPGMVLLFAFG